MKARLPALLVAVLCVLCVLGAVWLVREKLRQTLPAKIERAPELQTEPSRAVQEVVAPAPLDQAERSAVPPATATASTDDEDESDPVTPEHPGPGQALLRVEVVALETEKALVGARLGMRPTSYDEEHDWMSSTQPDPARGVENDEVITNVSGRGEFVLQAGFAYTLYGEGENGLAEEQELPLEPFRAGEERELRLPLRTAWDFDWFGRVVDGETELPIAGAEVTVLATYSAETLDGLHALASGTTAVAGRVILRLPAWEHMSVSARAPGYFRAGCRVEEDQLSLDAAGLVTLYRSASLDARVLQADGAPAEEVEVRVHTGAYQIVHDVMVEEVEWRARTDSQGRCAFEELPARVDLTVDLLRGERALQRPDGRGVKLEPGERRVDEWRLQAGCKLTGVVRDAEGQPIADVPLDLTKLSGTALWQLGLEEGAYSTADTSRGAVARVRSDATGSFSIDEVLAGSWMLSPAEEAEQLPQAGLSFEIDEGQGEKAVEIELARGLEIAGLVLDPEGKPVGDLPVLCHGLGAHHESFEVTAWCERDGTFSLGPLLAGEYAVVAKPDDPLQAESVAVLARTGARDVTLRLRWGGTLGGTVVDAETGEPVAARVTYGRLGFGFLPPSESFHFERLLPGTYDLVACTDDGRIGVLGAVPVRARERNDELALPVRRGAKLTVRTQAPEGAFFRVEVEWQGIPVASSWGDPEAVAVPPGSIVVRWFVLDHGFHEELEHEEPRIVGSADEELVLEHRIR